MINIEVPIEQRPADPVMLGNKSRYLTSTNLIVNKEICEYDIKSSNTSIAREYHLLSSEECDELEALPKQEREIKVGLKKRDDEEYSKKEAEGLKAAKRKFIEQNELTIPEIVSIKGDAFFIQRDFIEHEWVGDYIHFRKKGEYQSYLYLDPVEVYHDRENRKLVVKQISDEVYQYYHENFLGNFIEEVLFDLENEVPVRKKVVRFFDDYKVRQLPKEYYREFNAASMYRYLNGKLVTDTYQELSDLNIDYNASVIIRLMCLLMYGNFD